jgi:hypothetical protein
MSTIRINFDWPDSIDGIEMSATPGPSTVMGSKSPIGGIVEEIEEAREMILATPGTSILVGSKRSIEDVDEETEEAKEIDIKRNFMMTVLAMNSSLEILKTATITELKLRKNEKRKEEIHHEFLLMDVIADPDARELLLYLLRNENFAEICNVNGIKMNGRSRGDSTRVVMNISVFYRFELCI